MSDESNERRLTTVEVNIANMSQGVTDIKNYLMKRSDEHLQVMTRLALIENACADTKEYQEKCEIDRLDHDKRLTSCEGFQGRQSKMVIAIAAIISTVIPSAVEWFKH